MADFIGTIAQKDSVASKGTYRAFRGTLAQTSTSTGSGTPGTITQTVGQIFP